MKRIATTVSVLLAITLFPTAAMAAEEEVAVELPVIVKVDSIDSLTEIVSELDAAVAHPLIESRGVFLVTRTDLIKPSDVDKRAKDLAKDIARDERVVWAEPSSEVTAEDDRFHAWPEASPDETATGPSLEQSAFALLRLSDAHDISTGAGVTVAVLDTGVDASHPLLADRMLPGYDMVSDDTDPAEETDGIDNDGDGVADEAHGHGTFVAGIIAQVAPDAQIVPIRVLDADGVGELHAVIEGMEYAIDSGVDVINLSFGLNEKSKSKALKDAFKRAMDAGITVVAAAGNQGDDDKHYPAAEKEIVSVGALGSSGAEIAGFSGRGKWVDIAAPGENIVSSFPGGGFATWGGTSMAAPIVTGQLALMAQLQPDAEPKDLQKMLWTSSRKPDHWDGAERGIVDVLAGCLEASG